MIPATIYIVKFEPSLMVLIFNKIRTNSLIRQLQMLHIV